MPQVPSSRITDIPKAQREKLRAMLYERAVLKYAFSWDKLSRYIDSLGGDPQDLKDCIAAFSDSSLKAVAEVLNDKIDGLFVVNGISTLLDVDPFGRQKDYIRVESTATGFSSDKAFEYALSKYKIPASTMQAIFANATTKTPYTTMQARDHAEGGSKKAKGAASGKR